MVKHNLNTVHNELGLHTGLHTCCGLVDTEENKVEESVFIVHVYTGVSGTLCVGKQNKVSEDT